MAFLSFILMNVASMGFIICHDRLSKTLIKAKSNKRFINENIEKSVRDLIVHFVQVQLFAR